jgi:hypothetical protein
MGKEARGLYRGFDIFFRAQGDAPADTTTLFIGMVAASSQIILDFPGQSFFISTRQKSGLKAPGTWRGRSKNHLQSRHTSHTPHRRPVWIFDYAHDQPPAEAFVARQCPKLSRASHPLCLDYISH